MNGCPSQQPWCTYALHIATFTSLAFLVDPLLLLSLWWGTADWKIESRQYAFWSQFIFMFAFTKVVKLVGLFRRNPSDIKYLPVSIIFGYLHGLIKVYALLTLNMVSEVQRIFAVRGLDPLTETQTSWGSRPDGDDNDSSRLVPLPGKAESSAVEKCESNRIAPYSDDTDEERQGVLREKPSLNSAH